VNPTLERGSQLTQQDDHQAVPLGELETRMRPGNFSQAGFLGPAENLADVLAADARELTSLGVSARELADRLRELLDTANATKSTRTSVGHYSVRIQRYKGAQICPFAPQPHENPCPGGGMRLASIDWDIRNTRTGFRLSGPGLIAHLIGMHGFFEGMQSPYRVGPRALAELLELGPFASGGR
jgi:hypothetical protein